MNQDFYLCNFFRDGRTYDQYNGAVSYAYANENWYDLLVFFRPFCKFSLLKLTRFCFSYGYGDYTATATGATAPAVDPYAANGRFVLYCVTIHFNLCAMKFREFRFQAVRGI